MSCSLAVARFASLRRLSTVHALRVAPSSLRALHIRRQFSSTPRKEASTPPNLDAFSAATLNSPLFKELANKPEVLQSMKDLLSVMQAEGISVDPANPPSPIKILMNSNARNQLMQTMNVLKEAGIDQQQLRDALVLMRPKDS